MDLNDIAIKNSGWIWSKLREARKFGYQIGEESITDFFILNFKKFGKGKLVINSYTKRKEALTGADWEWWFTGPSGKWIGMRVQAKILNLKAKRYQHLHHKNNTGSQLTSLLTDAASNNVIPLYCMYSNWDPTIYKQKSKCKCKKHSVYHYGASLLDPQIIKKYRPEKSLKKFITHLIPLQCLFCTSKYGGSDLPNTVLAFSKSMGLIHDIEEVADKDSDTVSNNENNKFLVDEPPAYVSQLIDLEGELDDFYFPDDRLQRVTIVKEVSADNHKKIVHA